MKDYQLKSLKILVQNKGNCEGLVCANCFLHECGDCDIVHHMITIRSRSKEAMLYNQEVNFEKAQRRLLDYLMEQELTNE